jgi:hypothetical protein
MKAIEDGFSDGKRAVIVRFLAATGATQRHAEGATASSPV